MTQVTRQKRVLICSIGHSLGSARPNTRKKAGADRKVVNSFSLNYCIAYAQEFERRGWDVEVFTVDKHVDSIDKWAVTYKEGQDWKEYDKVLVMYCSSNFYGGMASNMFIPVLDQINIGDLGDTELIFFTDDSANRPSNPFQVLYHRLTTTGLKGFGSKLRNETHGWMLERDPEWFAKLKHMADWSVTDDGPRVMMAGGEVSVRRHPGDKHGFGPGKRDFIDHNSVFYGAKVLSYGWDLLPPLQPEEMEYDTLYAGAKRKGRTQVMVPVFERPDLKTLSILRFDREKYDLDIASWPNHADTEVVPTEESPELHAKCWVVPIVGDKWQTGQQVSSRFWFSMQIPTVAAIHTSYDPSKGLIKDEWLKQEMYYTTPDELAALVAKVKADPEYRQRLIDAQRAERPEPTEELFQ